MSTKRNPDHEMDIMRRGLRDLHSLDRAGRRRVLQYWWARADAMPANSEDHGPQQLDIEDALPAPAFLKGAAA